MAPKYFGLKRNAYISGHPTLVKMFREDALIFGLRPDKRGSSSIECQEVLPFR
jgi:hypothetical protein